MLSNTIPALIAVMLCVAGAAIGWLAPSAQVIVLAIMIALTLAVIGIWAINRRDERSGDDGLGKGLGSAMVAMAAALFIVAILLVRAGIWLAQPLIG